MEAAYGVGPEDGLAMWVADMDFRPPHAVQQAVERAVAHGVYGYLGDNRPYLDAICWWMQTRHGWSLQPDWILTTHGPRQCHRHGDQRLHGAGRRRHR